MSSLSINWLVLLLIVKKVFVLSVKNARITGKTATQNKFDGGGDAVTRTPYVPNAKYKFHEF